ncbi:MAG TPA: carboxypeptidase-like regulatory domain-containing protein [Armatimonadaceae bacterium]|nr:carboxypeptidase-like regulatory domain-containing protein [Armatimonadaceae bacterium]
MHKETRTGLRLLAAALLTTQLFGGALTTGAPVFAVPQEAAASSQTTGVALPGGPVRREDAGLPAGFGRLLASVAKEIDLPAAAPGGGGAEVLFWTLKPGRAKFTRTAVEGALQEGGYKVAAVNSDDLRETNPFDESFGLSGDNSAVGLGFGDRVSYFTAKSAEKRRTLVGAWIESEKRLILALAPVEYREEAKDLPLPEVASGPGVIAVKDIRDAMKGIAPPKPPAFPKLAKKPRTLRGAALDAAGKPLAGAQIIVQASAAGGFRTDVRTRTNAQGVYEMPLPVGVAQVVNADCAVRYNGKSYLLPLHPADGEREHFNSQQGHVENFTLRTYGPAGPDTAQSPQHGYLYYGGYVRAVWFSQDIPDDGTIEVTLSPSGPLMGGVTPRTLVFRFPSKGGEIFLNDAPIGRYTLKARFLDGAESLPLRAKKVFGESELSASLPVEFDPKEGSLASLGQSGVKQFDIMLQP